jgi:hypothetical protein
MKTIIMPGDPFDKKKPDSSFEAEYNSVKKFGNVFFFNLEEFLEGDILSKLPPSPNPIEEIFYHGWMMNWAQYNRFDLELRRKGYQLTNSPEQYIAYHHFNNWYPAIEGLTPKSVMVNNTAVRPVLDAALALRKETNSALIIKDAVKSLKHDWFEACFIPADAEPFAMAKVIANFMETKKSYNDLKLPVVLRQFEKLVSVGKHSKSKMPISHEYRTYVYKGKVLLQTPYWDAEYPNSNLEPDPEFINIIMSRLSKSSSNLFTIDTALKVDGEWTCIEVGDGQVSSLPDQANKDEFFSKLLGTNNE